MVKVDNQFAEYTIAPLDITVAIDTTLMWCIYIAYVLFWGNALQFHRKDGVFSWVFYKTAVLVIVCYIVWGNIIANFPMGSFEVYPFLFVRLYLGCFGMLVTLLALRKRESPFYLYLAGGSISIIVSSLFSAYVQQYRDAVFGGISGLGWMMFGFFFDVIFFSAAIGYRLKEESVEREQALQKVIDQQEEIKKLELDKVKAVYETREQERNRISSELHDDLGGGLSTIKLMVEMVQRSDDLKAQDCLDRIALKSKELVQNMNEIIWSLNTGSDSLQGTIAYIRQYAYNYLEETTINLIVKQQPMPEDIKMNGAVRRQLFLLVKESLHNILKHAQAGEVVIEFFYKDGLSVKVSDNGVGMASGHPIGNGLVNMRTRVAQLNGELKINGIKGTSVFFSIPYSSFYNKSAISDSLSKG